VRVADSAVADFAGHRVTVGAFVGSDAEGVHPLSVPCRTALFARLAARSVPSGPPLKSASSSLIAPPHHTHTRTSSPCALSVRPARPSPLELRRPLQSRHSRSPSVNDAHSAAMSDMSGLRRRIAPLLAFMDRRIAPLVA
jgi:hypothetical protein